MNKKYLAVFTILVFLVSLSIVNAGVFDFFRTSSSAQNNAEEAKQLYRVSKLEVDTIDSIGAGTIDIDQTTRINRGLIVGRYSSFAGPSFFNKEVNIQNKIKMDENKVEIDTDTFELNSNKVSVYSPMYISDIYNVGSGVIDIKDDIRLNRDLIVGGYSSFHGPSFFNKEVNIQNKIKMDENKVEIDTTEVKISSLSGNGNKYLCIDSEGYLFRSNIACPEVPETDDTAPVDQNQPNLT